MVQLNVSKIICVEGIDGAGKHTLTAAYSQFLQQHDYSVGTYAFPHYEHSVYAQLADRALHGHYPQLISDPVAMALLFATDRHHSRMTLEHLIQTHDVVLIDRYVASNIAYTAARLEATSISEMQWLENIEFNEFKVPSPHAHIFVTASTGETASRIVQRAHQSQGNRTSDCYEKDLSLQEKVSQWYQMLRDQQWRGPWFTFCTQETAAEDYEIFFHTLTQATF